MDVLYVLTGERAAGLSSGIPADEQLLLDAYRALPVAKRKAVLVSLITGAVPRKPAGGIQVMGNNNRTAGRDYNEGE